MTKEVKIILILVVVAFIGWFVWPTLYRYENDYSSGLPIKYRTNRLTNEVQLSTPRGWIKWEIPQLFNKVENANINSTKELKPYRGETLNGNWWKDQDEQTRLMFMLGFFKGMPLGGKLSFWKDYNMDKPQASAQKAIESYSEYANKYFNGVDIFKHINGLNEFYSDHRNRTIMIDDAVWLGANKIAGMPQNEFDKLIIQYRKTP